MRDLEVMFEQLADVGTPRGHRTVMQDAVGTVGTLSSRPVRSGRRVLAFGVALIFVLTVAGTIALVSANKGSRPTVDLPVVDPSPLRDLFDTSDQPAPSGVRYLVPNYVPVGMQLIRAAGGDRPGSVDSCGGTLGVDRAQLWTKLDPSGRPTASFSVVWGPAKASSSCPLPIRRSLDRTALRLDGAPTPVRGRTGFFNHGVLGWEETKGTIVRVQGANLTADELRGIADTLERRADGGFRVTRAPGGFVEVGESDGFASKGANQRELVYRSPDGPGFSVLIGDSPGAPPGANLSEAVINETRVHVTRVRGRHAVGAKDLHNNPGGFAGATFFLQGATSFLQWLEPGNVEVTLSGVGMSEPELVAIANGLRVVDQRGWNQFTTQATQLPATPTGDQPPFTGTRADIADAYSHWLDSMSASWLTAHTEGVENLGPTLEGLERKAPGGPYMIDVKSIQLSDQQHARVRFDVTTPDGLHLPDQVGGSTLVDGRWLTDRATLCALAPLVGVQCPAN